MFSLKISTHTPEYTILPFPSFPLTVTAFYPDLNNLCVAHAYAYINTNEHAHLIFSSTLQKSLIYRRFCAQLKSIFPFAIILLGIDFVFRKKAIFIFRLFPSLFLSS